MAVLSNPSATSYLSTLPDMQVDRQQSLHKEGENPVRIWRLYLVELTIYPGDPGVGDGGWEIGDGVCAAGVGKSAVPAQPGVGGEDRGALFG